jgi:two-component system, chemotaxis family, protein-glutamate methylesterase/glutaminase
MGPARTATSPIRVLIADNSLVMRETLRRAIESEPSFEVCGTAADGLQTLEKVRELQPDVVTLDVQMPLLDGIEVLKRIMKEFPRPVIMVSSHTTQGAEVTMEALNIGASDYLPKPGTGRASDPRRFRDELVSKIEAAARSMIEKSDDATRPPALTTSREPNDQPTKPEIIAVGTSTGGPAALQEILPELPADLPVGVIVVQHMPPGFTGPLAERLDLISEIKITEAQYGDTIEPGTVYIAPAGMHITVKRQPASKPTIVLSDYLPGTLHKPSVDLMMLSVAAVFGSHSCGVILTGMGRDGLQGMMAIHRAGGTTIGQDEATCTVYGMPRVCAEKGVLQKILPLSDITKEILHILKYADPDRREVAGPNPAELQGIVR